MRHCVDRMYGLWDDGYDYHDLNAHLNVQTKQFIKQIVTDPCGMRLPRLSKRKLHLTVKGGTNPYTDSELVHIAILAVECKRQTAIVHAMKAIYDYLASRGHH